MQQEDHHALFVVIVMLQEQIFLPLSILFFNIFVELEFLCILFEGIISIKIC